MAIVIKFKLGIHEDLHLKDMDEARKWCAEAVAQQVLTGRRQWITSIELINSIETKCGKSYFLESYFIGSEVGEWILDTAKEYWRMNPTAP